MQKRIRIKCRRCGQNAGSISANSLPEWGSTSRLCSKCEAAIEQQEEATIDAMFVKAGGPDMLRECRGLGFCGAETFTAVVEFAGDGHTPGQP